MSFTKLCSYDVNGFRDQAARNWEISADGEERQTMQITHGGLLSSVVCAGTVPHTRWIGGAQAALAPHGRGDGWGEVGKAERRFATRGLLTGKPDDAEALGAAFTGLVSGARYNVMAVDDVGIDVEAQQERVLRAAQKARLSNPLLVWRSVLAVLYHISRGLLAEGHVVGIVSHCEDGLAVQRMRILSRDGVLAPERNRPAQVVPSAGGLGELVMSARHAMLSGERISQGNAHRPQARMVASLALGEPVSAELLRNNRGRWELLEPVTMPMPTSDIEREDLIGLQECDFILFETVASGVVADTVAGWCAEILARDIERLPQEAVALGGLEAARRIQKREPVYFDFLPQISTIVQTGSKAENYDLIRAGDTVEAGRLYRSPEPAQMAIPARQDAISVYLRKEVIAQPRRATVEIGTPLQSAAPVDLLVEQKPVSGRARILMESRDIGRQFTVDWDEAEVVDMDWDTLIASLEAPRPSIPERLVLGAALDAWQTGMTELLEENAERDVVDWAALSKKMQSRVNQGHCVSSDGELPRGLSLLDIERLNRLTERALKETADRVAGRRQDKNEALAFLTWQFRRCPRDLLPMLMDCLTGDGDHPFIWTTMNWKLVYQGAARIVSDPDDEVRLMRHVLQTGIGEMEWFSKTACIAMMLSRSPTAPLALSRDDVDALATHVLFEFGKVVGDKYTRFTYARFLLGGLLRWRVVEPYALVPGYDPLGEQLEKSIEAILADFDLRARRYQDVAKAERRLRPTFEGLLSELKGDGGSPDLLLNIYESS